MCKTRITGKVATVSDHKFKTKKVMSMDETSDKIN